jgi:hypothetical protein
MKDTVTAILRCLASIITCRKNNDSYQHLQCYCTIVTLEEKRSLRIKTVLLRKTTNLKIHHYFGFTEQLVFLEHLTNVNMFLFTY